MATRPGRPPARGELDSATLSGSTGRAVIDGVDRYGSGNLNPGVPNIMRHYIDHPRSSKTGAPFIGMRQLHAHITQHS